MLLPGIPLLGFEKNKQFHPPCVNTTDVVTLGACMQGDGCGHTLLRESWGSDWMRLLCRMFQSSNLLVSQLVKKVVSLVGECEGVCGHIVVLG